DAGLLWKSCEEDLQSQLTEVAWHTCFHSALPVGIEGDEFVLSVPSAVFKERIENRYEGLVNGCLADAGAPHLRLRVEVRPDGSDPQQDPVPAVSVEPEAETHRPATPPAPAPRPVSEPAERVLIRSEERRAGNEWRSEVVADR